MPTPDVPINPTLLENAGITYLMPLQEPIKPKEAAPPKKREWCCNELVILLSTLWICGLIFDLAFNSKIQWHQTHQDETAFEKMAQYISLAVMGVVLLFFVAVLTTTRLIYPDGKVAAYFVKEKKCMIGILNFIIMLIILANIIFINFLSKHYGGDHQRLALMYVSMSCIPKLMARSELNLPLCILMIVFEASMVLTCSFTGDDDDDLAIPFYFY